MWNQILKFPELAFNVFSRSFSKYKKFDSVYESPLTEIECTKQDHWQDVTTNKKKTTHLNMV
jgi:hypothetical protein